MAERRAAHDSTQPPELQQDRWETYYHTPQLPPQEDRAAYYHTPQQPEIYGRTTGHYSTPQLPPPQQDRREAYYSTHQLPPPQEDRAAYYPTPQLLLPPPAAQQDRAAYYPYPTPQPLPPPQDRRASHYPTHQPPPQSRVGYHAHQPIDFDAYQAAEAGGEDYDSQSDQGKEYGQQLKLQDSFHVFSAAQGTNEHQPVKNDNSENKVIRGKGKKTRPIDDEEFRLPLLDYRNSQSTLEKNRKRESIIKKFPKYFKNRSDKEVARFFKNSLRHLREDKVSSNPIVKTHGDEPQGTRIFPAASDTSEHKVEPKGTKEQ